MQQNQSNNKKQQAAHQPSNALLFQAQQKSKQQAEIFEKAIKKKKLVPVYKNGSEIGTLNTKFGLVYPCFEEFNKLKNSCLLVRVKQCNVDEQVIFFSVLSKQLWFFTHFEPNKTIKKQRDTLNASSPLGQTDWFRVNHSEWASLIDKHEVFKSKLFLNAIKSLNVKHWKVPNGFLDPAKPDEYIGSVTRASGIAFVNQNFKTIRYRDIYDLCILNCWHLDFEGTEFKPILASKDTSAEGLYKFLQEHSLSLTNTVSQAPDPLHAEPSFVNLDYTPCRQPKLTLSQLQDQDKGLWELHGAPTEELKKWQVLARDPGLDLQHRSVAIDFGTSSTVVAVATKTGGKELLRIGVRDYFEQPKPHHFENPTVLEFLDFDAFVQQWGSTAYRPALNWGWVRASHEAQADFRDNPGDTEVLASILPHLKQWALRSSADRRIKLTGRKGKEVELEPHSERNPVRGQPIQVSAEDPVDPIELYAWYLGMAINWRGRGLFLKYYLSFPVKYPREVKERILSSFRRGLQRSLPVTLVESHPQALNDFEVNDLASEPAAYAAAALPHLQIEPTEEGVAYAVFDFGGGTSDFDFGLMRWANEEQENQGYETVFEHQGSGGDNFLGAENLLAHLVYETFKQNQAELRSKKVQFTAPMDASRFAGSEMLVATTQAAQTNAIILAAKLRDFMESEQPRISSQLKIDLIDANSNKQQCELALDDGSLDKLLRSRIHQGMKAFLYQLAQVMPLMPSNEVHLLLAGNGSRSRYITELFANKQQKLNSLLGEVFGSKGPSLIPHQPLPINHKDVNAPTSKTGVALGLLELTPGSSVLMLNLQLETNNDQAPFLWSVGRSRRRAFEPQLDSRCAYQEWQKIGVLQQGAFKLYATQSPRAMQGMAIGDQELVYHELNFPAAIAGAKLFARAVSPNSIELGYGASVEETGENHISELKFD